MREVLGLSRNCANQSADRILPEVVLLCSGNGGRMCASQPPQQAEHEERVRSVLDETRIQIGRCFVGQAARSERVSPPLPWERQCSSSADTPHLSGGFPRAHFSPDPGHLTHSCWPETAANSS